MNTISTHFFGMPVTRSGRRAVWLELAFLVMFVTNVAIQLLITEPDAVLQQFAPPLQNLSALFPFYILSMLGCGIAGGILGIRAVIHQHERSLLVWIAILLGLFVLLIFLNELRQALQYFINA